MIEYTNDGFKSMSEEDLFLLWMDEEEPSMQIFDYSEFRRLMIQTGVDVHE